MFFFYAYRRTYKLTSCIEHSQGSGRLDRRGRRLGLRVHRDGEQDADAIATAGLALKFTMNPPPFWTWPNGLRVSRRGRDVPSCVRPNGLVAAVGWSALFGFTGPHGNAVICTSPP
jgi:hypothetical protein